MDGFPFLTSNPNYIAKTNESFSVENMESRLLINKHQ